MKELAPEYLIDLLFHLKNFHSHPTHNEHLLQIPPCRTIVLKQSFAFNAAVCWNSLSKPLSNAPSICENFRKNKHF